MFRLVPAVARPWPGWRPRWRSGFFSASALPQQPRLDVRRAPSGTYTAVCLLNAGVVCVPFQQVTKSDRLAAHPERSSAVSWAPSPAQARIAASAGRVQFFRG